MIEPETRGESGPAPPGSCFYCRSSLDPDALFCSECDRYQPGERREGFGTKSCLTCAEQIPRAAVRCNHCDSFQRGLRRILPVSAATVSALGALASLAVLLINTLVDLPSPPRSQTEVTIFDQDGESVYLRAVNRGNEPSFVGKAWLWLETECPGKDGHRSLCDDPAALPPDETLVLQPLSREDAFVQGGLKVIAFRKDFDLDLDDLPLPVEKGCLDFDQVLARVEACFEVEVVEHGDSEGRCDRYDRPAASISTLLRKMMC